MRDRNFYSLQELNEAFKEYLQILNHATMKDWGVSRAERFEGEKNILKPLPAENWQSSDWKMPKVHADCHIQVLKKFYSVPYQKVGQEVRVRVTAKMIEVFDQNLNSLCVHVRLLGKENYSTDPSHYPEEKLALTQFSVQVAKREAVRVGIETEKLVEYLLNVSYPLRHLRRVQGILRLHKAGHVTRQGLEHACKMGLTFNKPQYAYIKATAKYFDRNGNRPKLVESAPVREAGSMYLHKQFNQEELNHDK